MGFIKGRGGEVGVSVSVPPFRISWIISIDRLSLATIYWGDISTVPFIEMQCLLLSLVLTAHIVVVNAVTNFVLVS